MAYIADLGRRPGKLAKI